MRCYVCWQELRHGDAVIPVLTVYQEGHLGGGLRLTTTPSKYAHDYHLKEVSDGVSSRSAAAVPHGTAQ